jgi:NADPH-dependent ferric siderophore reductase
MQRIRVEGKEIATLQSVPGQHVRFLVSDLREPRNWLRPKDFLRTYSVWRHDEGIEVGVVDHDEGGPGVRWARDLRVGQRVSFLRPDGSFALRDAPYHVFAGDETAVPAFDAMLRSLRADIPAFGIVEAEEPADEIPLGAGVTWRFRHGRPAFASDSLVEAVRELELPPEPGAAYLAGEARTIQMLRRFLVSERGWPRESVTTKPFWTPGKRGMD